jgi:hypothetical protein
MARRPRPPPPPSPLISFTEPEPSSDDHLIRIAFDPASKKWGFYSSYALDERDLSEIVGLEYPFNTVEAATIRALQHLEPHWGDRPFLWIHGGVVVPNMPANARITGSPGYRARIDAGLYNLDLEQLRALHFQTERQMGMQERSLAINYDIPIGQQVLAFYLLWERMPRRSRPKLNDWLDEVMPRVRKRTRQRHVRTFLIVSDEDWPVILATTEIAITGMESILRAARAFRPTPPRKRTKTPLKERYLTLRDLVYRQHYEEARILVLTYDEEDANVAERSYADEDSE